jgi:7tm Odorant receptor
MSVLPTYIAMLLKSINFITHIGEIKLLFDTIETVLEKDPMSEKFKKRIQTVDKVFKFFWASAVMTTVLGSLIPFVTHELAYRMWFPYDYNNNDVLFWISASFQIFESCSYCGLDMVLNMVPVFFMVYILGMLEQLCDRLDELKRRKTLNPDGSINRFESNNNSKEFLKCIEYHLNILQIKKRVEKIFSTVLLLQGLMSTLILCTTSYALTIVRIFI